MAPTYSNLLWGENSKIKIIFLIIIIIIRHDRNEDFADCRKVCFLTRLLFTHNISTICKKTLFTYKKVYLKKSIACTNKTPARKCNI